jgi:hypothetical protein
MTDHDFRYDRVLSHHHTHIYSLIVIIYTQIKKLIIMKSNCIRYRNYLLRMWEKEWSCMREQSKKIHLINFLPK